LRISRIIDYIGAVIVCVCNRLTESEVRKATRAGAATPEKAYACLGCEPQCGCCLDYAQEIIDDEHGRKPGLRLVA
jgi:bacterioferritin-associated ferredoxin